VQSAVVVGRKGREAQSLKGRRRLPLHCQIQNKQTKNKQKKPNKKENAKHWIHSGRTKEPMALAPHKTSECTELDLYFLEFSSLGCHTWLQSVYL